MPLPVQVFNLQVWGSRVPPARPVGPRRAPPRSASLPRGVWDPKSTAASGGAVRPSPGAPREGCGSRPALGPRSPFRRVCVSSAVVREEQCSAEHPPAPVASPAAAVFDWRVVRAVGRAGAVAEGTVRWPSEEELGVCGAGESPRSAEGVSDTMAVLFKF